MNICFLDLDGVLNSQLYFQSEGYRKGSDSRMEHWLNQIDPVTVTYLNSFVKKTDCKVVISSTWRDTAFENRILYHKGFEGDIIDVTPHLQHRGLRSMVRGNEIFQWMFDNQDLIGCSPYDYKKYVIFDDDSDMLLWQKDNFFNTDPYCGLTPNVTYRAERFLSRTNNISKTLC